MVTVGNNRGYCGKLPWSLCRLRSALLTQQVVVIVSKYIGKLPWSLWVITVVIVSTEVLFTNEQVVVAVQFPELAVDDVEMFV